MYPSIPLYQFGSIVMIGGIGMTVRDRAWTGKHYRYQVGERENIENTVWLPEETLMKLEAMGRTVT